MIVATVMVVAALGLAVGIGFGKYAEGSGAGRTQTLTHSGVDQPPRDGDHEATLGDGMIPSLGREYRRRQGLVPQPVLSGTKLMLRAISEYNPEQRRIRVGDLARHLRGHPEVKPDIYTLVDRFLANNPHMAIHGARVKQMLESELAHNRRNLPYLDY